MSPAAWAEPLPALDLSPASTTVSGLSSGGFMALQLQVALSEHIADVGVVAGGPYSCADGNVYRALRVCMNAFLGEAAAEDALKEMRTLGAEGRIDDLEHLAEDRIYLFHGQADDTVARASMDALRRSYAELGVLEGQIAYETEVAAGHGFVTERGDFEFADTGPDLLIDCDYNQAGAILAWLYGDLAPSVEPRDGELLRFDQERYLQGATGMDDTAFVYVPEPCVAGTLCHLHIALHGCRHGREVIGADYARLTGYNAWAEANRIVALYPQAQRIPSPWWNWFRGNPNGCWDWWGYAGDDYLSKDAPQIAAIARMATALGAPFGGAR